MSRPIHATIAFVAFFAMVFASSPSDVFGEIEAASSGGLPAAFVKDNEDLSPLVRTAKQSQESMQRQAGEKDRLESDKMQQKFRKEDEDARVHDITDYASIPNVAPITVVENSESPVADSADLKKQDAGWSNIAKSEDLFKSMRPIDDAAKQLEGFRQEAKAALVGSQSRTMQEQAPEPAAEDSLVAPWHDSFASRKARQTHVDMKKLDNLHKHLRDASKMPRRY